MVKPTSEELNTKIILRFRFPINSIGLLNKQFLGVSFPKLIGINDALFDVNTKPNNFRYNCELLYDNVLIKTNPIYYTPSLVSYKTENNVAYCQINDPINSPLIPQSDKILKLSITLTQITIKSLKFIHNLELFSATSASIDKIIIDSYSNFGSLAVYGQTVSPPLLDIFDASAIVTKGPVTNKIFILNTFDITLILTVNGFISFRDSLFVIRFPSDAVTAPTVVSSSELDPVDHLQSDLKSDNLRLSNLDSNSISIQGINEDLVYGRQFKLTLKNFIAQNSKTTNKNIEVIIYYLNSLTQISYSSNAVFAINLIELENVSIAHPDHDNIFSGHAYPIDFEFKVNTDINIPSLVSFQHSRAIDTPKNNFETRLYLNSAKLNFIASTCDFTLNGLYDSYFGIRPKCYPMRLDFDYPGASSQIEYKGSGIVFKVNSLSSKIVYKIRVWIVFDECGSTTNALALHIADNKLSPYVNFKFNINIHEFKRSNKYKLNYNYGIAFVETEDIIMTKTSCWQSSKSEIFKTDDPPIGDWQNSSPLTDNKGIIMVKEINNFNLLESYTQNEDYSSVNGLNNNNIYINSSRNFSVRQNYLFLKNDFLLSNGEFLYNHFPFNLSYSKSSTTFTPLKGNLEFRFSRSWFKNGNYEPNQKSCWVSWGFRDNPNTIKPDLYHTNDSNTVLKSKKNLIYLGKEFNASSTVDLSTLILPNSSETEMLRIASKYQINSNNFDFSENYNFSKTGGTSMSFLLFSNCLAINDKIPNIKSIYSYFEGNINWIYTHGENDKKYTLRVVRYLKLFPSLGFFNDPNNTNNIIRLTNIDSLFKFHYVNTRNEDANSICILEVKAEVLKDFQAKMEDSKISKNSYIYQMNFFNLSLLETDYENIAINYPIMQLIDETNNNLVQVISDFYQSSLTLNRTNKSLTSISKINSNEIYDNSNNMKMILYAYLTSNIRILNLKDITNKYGLKNDQNNDLVIPTSCPFRKTTDDNSFFSVPVITTFLYSHNNFGNIDRNFVYATLNSPDNPNVFLFPSTKKFKSHTPQYTTLRFTEYSVNDIDKINLAISFGTNFSKVNYSSGRGDVGCSGISLLLNSDIEINNINQIEINFNSLKINKIFYSINKMFLNSNYFFLNKIGFNKFIIGLEDNLNISVADQNNNKAIDKIPNPGYIIKGIKRPTIDYYSLNNNDKNYLNLEDKISFACSSIIEYDYYATNYIVYKEYNNSVANFILDIKKDDSKEWSYISNGVTKKTEILQDDNNNTLYRNELTGNFKINGYFPIPAPGNSFLKIESNNNFNRNSICGIYNNFKNNLVNDCFIKDNLFTKIYCPIYSKEKYDIPDYIKDITDPNLYFNLCCYNISLKNSISLSLEIELNMDESIKGIRNFISSSFIKDNGSVKDLVLKDNNFTTSDSPSPVTIKTISYIFSNHDGAIGKMKILINFPRDVIRNSKIIISTSAFSQMLIPNSNIICQIISTNEYSKIEPFIDSCIINLDNSLHTIIIKFKNIIYSCGIKLPTSIFVLVSPIKIVPLENQTYIVNWFINDTEEFITNTEISQIFPEGTIIKYTPKITDEWENLCNIILIFPRLIGEYAYYDFDINTELFNEIQENININEISIFFPANFYSDENLANLYCYLINLPNIICKVLLEEKGIISVKFNSNIYNKIENPRLRIIGIQNPNIEENISFPCSLNYKSNNELESNYNIRYNLITGSGILKGGLNNNLIKIGNIRLYYKKNFLSNFNPRSKGLYIFKLGFDLNSGIILPLTISNNPIVVVNFPDQYALYKYAFSYSSNSLYISASIEEFIEDENNIIISNGYLAIKNTFVINNSIHIYLDESTKIIPDKFRNWEIKLNYVPGPNEPIQTGSYGLVLTNNPNTIYIEIFTNSDTMITTENNTNTSDPFFKYNRGVKFDYDNLKIILDVIDHNLTDIDNNYYQSINKDLSKNKRNYVQLHPGIFKEITISVREILGSLKSSITKITLDDSIFITHQKDYTFSSSSNQITILLGAPCSTLKGLYYINFKLSNLSNFLEMSPIAVYVRDIKPSIISFDLITTIPLGSSQLIKYSLKEKNVDILDIIWESDKENDSSAHIESISIHPGEDKYSVFFSIANSISNSPQTFSSNDPNYCFKLERKELTFRFDSNYADLSLFINNPEEFKSQFYIFDHEKDNSKKKNSFIIIYTPKIFPVYLFCSIVCYDSEFPSDEEILSSTDKNWFFQKYVNSKDRFEIYFNNLMKNTQYKIKCIVQTTESDIMQRKHFSSEMFRLYLKENIGFITLIDIKTSKMPATRCINFEFRKIIGNIIKDALLNYCQKFYNKYDGCVVCIDNAKRNSLGIDFGTFYGCNLNEGKKNIQLIDEKNIFNGPLIKNNNQINIKHMNNLNNDYFDEDIVHNIFTLCPVQDLYCSKSLNDDEYDISVVTLQNQLNTDTDISTNLHLPSLKLQEVNIISDKDAPNFNKLSFEIVSVNYEGNYFFIVKNPTAVFCYYLIKPSTALIMPKVHEITTCKDTSRCGTKRIISEYSDIRATKEKVKVFDNGTYDVWFICMNDIPNPTILSEIKKVGTFIINNYRISIDILDANANTIKINILFIFVLIFVNILY